MWVSMCFPRAVDSYFIVKKRPYSLAKIATRGVRPGYVLARVAAARGTMRVLEQAVRAASSALALGQGDMASCARGIRWSGRVQVFFG